MSVRIQCDSCPFGADIDAPDCPDRLEIWSGGDAVEGEDSSVVCAWHACAACKERFFSQLPAVTRKGEEAPHG